MIKTAILVDGAFYRKRAYNLFGDLTPSERAKELEDYCKRHIKDEKAGAMLKNNESPTKKNLSSLIKKAN